jgi:hypothetical protein
MRNILQATGLQSAAPKRKVLSSSLKKPAYSYRESENPSRKVIKIP